MRRCLFFGPVLRTALRVFPTLFSLLAPAFAYASSMPASATAIAPYVISAQEMGPLARPVPPSGSAPASEEQQLAAARQLIAASRFQQAATLLRACLAVQPASPEPLYLLGEAELRLNNPAESLADFTRAAALRRPTGEELRLVGLDYILLNDNSDAVRWLERAAGFSPANPEIWYSLGRAYYGEGKYDEARRCFVKTLALAPANAKAEDNLGLALEAENQPDAALEAYGKAIVIENGSAGASEQPFLNYGALQIHRGRNAEAADALRHATLLAPGCSPCHETYGRALLALDQLPAALREFETAVRLEPGNPRYHYELGRLLRKTGNPARSEQEMRLSAALYGSHSTK